MLSLCLTQLTWLRALKEAKVMYGYDASRRHKLGATLGGLLREEGDQRRKRIDQTVTLKGTMREWEGRKWIEQVDYGLFGVVLMALLSLLSLPSSLSRSPCSL